MEILLTVYSTIVNTSLFSDNNNKLEILIELTLSKPCKNGIVSKKKIKKFTIFIIDEFWNRCYYRFILKNMSKNDELKYIIFLRGVIYNEINWYCT
jgi:hypothetical protein